MKYIVHLLIITSLLMVYPTVAAADHYSEGKLLQDTCNEAIKFFDSPEKADAFQAGSCLGYIRAANDMYEIMVNNANRTICIPSGMDAKHLIMVVLKYFNEHPDKLLDPASASIYEAFQIYFPCKKPGPPQ